MNQRRRINDWYTLDGANVVVRHQGSIVCNGIVVQRESKRLGAAPAAAALV